MTKVHIKNDEYLVIEVDYKKSGWNYFSGSKEEGGVQVTLTKENLEVAENGRVLSRRFEVFNAQNFRVLAMPLERKNQKKIDFVKEHVEHVKNELLELFLAGDKKSIFQKLRFTSSSDEGFKKTSEELTCTTI